MVRTLIKAGFLAGCVGALVALILLNPKLVVVALVAGVITVLLVEHRGRLSRRLSGIHAPKVRVLAVVVVALTLGLVWILQLTFRFSLDSPDVRRLARVPYVSRAKAQGPAPSLEGTYSGTARLEGERWILSETFAFSPGVSRALSTSGEATSQIIKDMRVSGWQPAARPLSLGFIRTRELSASSAGFLPARTTNVIPLHLPAVGPELTSRFAITEDSNLTVIAEEYAVLETYPSSAPLDLLRDGLVRFDVLVVSSEDDEVRVNLVSTPLRFGFVYGLLRFSISQWSTTLVATGATALVFTIMRRGTKARPLPPSS